MKRRSQRRIPEEYRSFLTFRCLSKDDVAQVNIGWSAVSGFYTSVSWDQLCKLLDLPFQVSNDAVTVLFKSARVRERDVAQLEIMYKGILQDSFKIDRADGGPLLERGSQDAEEVRRVRCYRFEPVLGAANIFYP